MKTSTKLLLFGGAIGLALLAFGSRYSFGGIPLRAGVNRDPKKLLPGFAKRVEQLFRAMRARGYSPMLWEGYRTPERAQELANKGSGIVDSLHIYGAAVDIVDESTAPNYWNGAPGFWTALGEEAERLGLTWGGRFSRRDVVHVQAVPVSQQVALRAATTSERVAMVA